MDSDTHSGLTGNGVRPEWLAEVEEALTLNSLNLTTQEIIPARLYDTYQAYKLKALAFGQNKAESEAAQYFYLYLIHKHQLWRAAYRSWEEFLDQECDMSPLMPGKASVKKKVGIIGELLELNVQLENIVMALGRAPTAIGELAAIPQASLPGGSYDVAAQELAQLGKGIAIAATRDWGRKPTIKCIDAFWDERHSVFYAKVRIKSADLNEPTVDKDLCITEVDDAEYAAWLGSRFRPARNRNED